MLQSLAFFLAWLDFTWQLGLCSFIPVKLQKLWFMTPGFCTLYVRTISRRLCTLWFSWEGQCSAFIHSWVSLPQCFLTLFCILDVTICYDQDACLSPKGSLCCSLSLYGGHWRMVDLSLPLLWPHNTGPHVVTPTIKLFCCCFLTVILLLL